ncbi:DEAD/DEAH box helicase [Sulfurimonas sp. HSL1-2]|uniref:DEAD/DEAH box helicase n=1 Tax=Thiomicrolovo zhangzhouensis TaxID=3131933 RepID=UPI0031F79593
MSFSTLGLSEPLLRAVADTGYSEPTPIQAQAIPVVLSGKDLLAGAQTGTGKTAGFTLPMLQLLSQAAPSKGKRPVRALVLTPTRELAAQVGQSVETYGKHLKLNSAVIFGGVNINPQINKLRGGVDIVVATPGRLLDHANQKNIDLSRIELLILDEADRMLDMGFIHDIKKVLKLVPKKAQKLLFSATFSDEIKTLADGLLHSPALIEVARRNTASERVAQVVYPVKQDRKRALLSTLITSNGWEQILVFTRTKHGANRLCKQLISDGIPSEAIHGNKTQNARTKALAAFKAKRVRVLVATDIAARGIDIDQLPHVVNFELPNVPEDYVHRIGRTGRAGNEGEAVSLVCAEEAEYLRNIEKLIKASIPQKTVEGFETRLPEKVVSSSKPKTNASGKRPARNGNERTDAKPRQGQRDKKRDAQNDRRKEQPMRAEDVAAYLSQMKAGAR